MLNCVSGAFASRWQEVSALNGKDNEVLEVPWGQPILPDMVADRLAGGDFDAVAVVHNETSTGVVQPIREIAQAVRSAPNGDDIVLLVDSVSGLSGAELETDAWDLDVVLTSSQKAFALPAGLAMGAVSDRAMERAKSVPNRGYYFDFLTLDKYLGRNQTPATPGHLPALCPAAAATGHGSGGHRGALGTPPGHARHDPGLGARRRAGDLCRRRL